MRILVILIFKREVKEKYVRERRNRRENKVRIIFNKFREVNILRRGKWLLMWNIVDYYNGIKNDMRLIDIENRNILFFFVRVNKVEERGKW